LRRMSRLVVVGCLALLVPGCTGGGGPPRGGDGAGTNGPAGNDPKADGGAPFVSRTVNFYGPNDMQRTVRLDVYPAVRVEPGLLVPVDLTAQGSERPAGSDYFCTDAVVCSDFGAASLIDPTALVRYGPLRDGSVKGAVLSSKIPYDLDLGVRYRAGVLFPVPDGAPGTVDLDLQYGGEVIGLPITSGAPPAALLDAGGASSTPSGGPDRVLPVAAATGSPFVDRHPLVAKVVGGTLNQGAGAKQGVVSLAADVLFDFDSATLTPKAQAVVTQAAQILAEKADPSQPVAVTGFTDAKGTDAYNATLSQGRAAAVADGLRGDPRTATLAFNPAGRGAADPVAPNERPDGSDDPAGRALNRRVEISYLPKPAATPSPAPAATGAPPAGEPTAVATLSAPQVIAGGAGPVAMTASVRSVRRVGALTLAEVTVTPGGPAAGVDYFARGRADHDVGAWRLVVPATGAEHIPANDADDPKRVLGTYVKQMNAGRAYLLSFWTAALPADVTAVDVDLGQLGKAKGVPVTG